MRHLPWLVMASACGDERATKAPPAPPPAARVVSPCPIGAVPANALVASRDLEGPWFYGQAVFEYLSPSPKVDGRHVNTNDTGGTSSVGRRGDALTFELPPNSSLPSESLLRHGPPPAIAYRASSAGSYRVRAVACPTDRQPPRVELTVLHRNGTVEPVSSTPVATLIYGGAGPHPSERALGSQLLGDQPLALDAVTDLEVGDAVRLAAVPVVDASGTLEAAFDLAVAPI